MLREQFDDEQPRDGHICKTGQERDIRTKAYQSQIYRGTDFQKKIGGKGMGGRFDDLMEDPENPANLVSTKQAEMKEVALRGQSNGHRNLQRRASGLSYNTSGIV